jgi:hypothetical protein
VDGRELCTSVLVRFKSAGAMPSGSDPAFIELLPHNVANQLMLIRSQGIPELYSKSVAVIPQE